MAFGVYSVEKTDGKEVEKEGSLPKKTKFTDAELLKVNHKLPKNDQPMKRFDVSRLNLRDDDVVALIDGDWLAFSVCSMEMKRIVEADIDGKTIEFSGYKKVRTHLKELGREDEYSTTPMRRTQFNHDRAVINAKSSAKKRIYKIINELAATKVVIFCGSTGNQRFDLPLPKLESATIDCWIYKGQRGPEWIPETLPEVKDWLQEGWHSHWSVEVESDDDMVITKNEVHGKGVKVYIVFVDKDFRNETVGGSYDYGQKEIWYKTGTEEDELGYFDIVPTKSGKTMRNTGSGHKFFAYQMLTSDDADNVHPKLFLRQICGMGDYGEKQIKKDLDACLTVKDVWQHVHDHYKRYIGDGVSYEDCYGVWHENKSAMYFLDLYYKAYKMLDHEGYVADIKELFDRLGVIYD